MRWTLVTVWLNPPDAICSIVPETSVFCESPRPSRAAEKSPLRSRKRRRRATGMPWSVSVPSSVSFDLCNPGTKV
ncbi:hypothetical protein JMJ76_0014352 [Colletotrichum scovillei]|nr:hypothetical protein JMJ76_0014352 [Colletotrichum scovillei]